MYNDPEVAPTIKAADKGSLHFKCVCLVGQTIPMDPEDFPHLDEPFAQSNSVLAENRYMHSQNTACWMMVHFMDKESYKRNDSFRTTEWGSESAEALARENGIILTLGDYIDKTPAQYLSKVVLEEIVFEKWYYKRAVLIGDELKTVFEEYRKERYPVAKAAFENSQLFRLNFGKTMMAPLVRVFLKRMPQWLWKKIVLSKHMARPQASFLPMVQDDGQPKPMAQQNLIKTLPILKNIVDDPAVLCTDSPELLAKATALKDAGQKRAVAAAEAGLVVQTPGPVGRSNASLAPNPAAVQLAREN
ncbi:hypothetical protein BG004_003698 [Podila humilis]|nr:hypothetical protein BG004_003698 [Podila humilis]